MNEVLSGLAGFSIGMAVLLAAGLLTLWRDLPGSLPSRMAGLTMLGGLALTSWQHIGFVDLPAGALPPAAYGSVLFLQSLGFYLLLRGVLQPPRTAGWRDALPWMGVGLLALLTPRAVQVPVAMLLGTGFALHLAWLLWRLRGLRRWFRLELPVVALFALMGALVAVAGLLTPGWLAWADFALIYSLQIALGFALAACVLVAVPDIADKTREAVEACHAQSTLGRVDVDAAAQRLRLLFEQEQVHLDAALSLPRLAARMDLSTHQLSELLNRHFGAGFSRAVRRYRVAAAKKMLVEEPQASVLSVGMAVGFGSQSTFYAAFRDEVGMVPGEYRRRAGGAGADGGAPD